MRSPNSQPLFKGVSEVVEKDLEFISSLIAFGEGIPSGENIWVAIDRSKYDVQTARRLYARMFISLVESVVFSLKTDALEWAYDIFTDAELAILQENSYELSDKGEATERLHFVRLESNFKFAFRCCSKAFGITYAPDYGGEGWQAFQHAINIRNRITHPKLTDQMFISETEQKTIERAYEWFIKCCRSFKDAYTRR